MIGIMGEYLDLEFQILNEIGKTHFKKIDVKLTNRDLEDDKNVTCSSKEEDDIDFDESLCSITLKKNVISL